MNISLLSTTLLFAVSVWAAERPNLVLIYADDLRWDTLGVVQREQGEMARWPWLQTPRLDRLAAESVRFRESFVVTSLCSPGRAGVMTSRYGHLTGIIGNSAPLPVETVTIATRLKEAGYTTAYCGKWHMDGQEQRPGYDFTASFVGQGRYYDCPLVVDGERIATQGWVDDVTTGYAVRFIEKQPQEKPFFLWLGFKSPHGPRGGTNLPERVKGLYATAESRPTPNTGVSAVYRAFTEGTPAAQRRATAGQVEGHRDFMRHATAIDTCVGEVLDALERTGQADRTVVLFTSDNGYYLGEHGLGDKRSAYDESLRVPLLIRPPGGVPQPGRTCDAMTLNIDYAPTLLDYAGAGPLPGAQGRSLRPFLEGRDPADWRQAFFYEYFMERNFATPTVLAVRTTTHKLIRYPGHDEWTEVFDLRADPYETRNLVSNEALLAELRTVFDAQSKAVAFRVPEGFVEPGPDAPVAPPRRRQAGTTRP